MPTAVFTHNAGYRIGYAIRSLHCALIIQDAGRNIIDGLLRFIFRRW